MHASIAVETSAIILPHAAVAQLDRVLGYEPRGRGFESCQPHHFFQRPDRRFRGRDQAPLTLEVALDDRSQVALRRQAASQASLAPGAPPVGARSTISPDPGVFAAQ